MSLYFLIGCSLCDLKFYRLRTFKEDKCLSHILMSKHSYTFYTKILSGIIFAVFLFVCLFFKTSKSVIFQKSKICNSHQQCLKHGWCSKNMFVIFYIRIEFFCYIFFILSVTIIHLNPVEV